MYIFIIVLVFARFSDQFVLLDLPLDRNLIDRLLIIAKKHFYHYPSLMVGLVVTGTAACALCRCATELFFVQTVFYFQALCEAICFQINFETKKNR